MTPKLKSVSPAKALVIFRAKVEALANPERAVHSLRFFKTGPGEYGEGDCFLGLTVPQARSLVKQSDGLELRAVLKLLHSKWHDERLIALFILVRRFERSKAVPQAQKVLVDLYLSNTRWINNWDLVDASAPYLLGPWLLTRDRSMLRGLAKSKDLWEQRIAVMATFAFIRAGQFSDTLELCEQLLAHPHDLMHKACGWMLREVGKRDLATLRAFLDRHTLKMARTQLRYAIEKLPEKERLSYLHRRV